MVQNISPLFKRLKVIKVSYKHLKLQFLCRHVRKDQQHAGMYFLTSKSAQGQDRSSWSRTIKCARMLYAPTIKPNPNPNHSKSRKATKSSYFDWNQLNLIGTTLWSHTDRPDSNRDRKKVYMQSVKSLQVFAFSLWKGISGQTNQLARSWNTVPSVFPGSLLASLKITLSLPLFQSNSLWTHNLRKPHQTQKAELCWRGGRKPNCSELIPEFWALRSSSVMLLLSLELIEPLLIYTQRDKSFWLYK